MQQMIFPFEEGITMTDIFDIKKEIGEPPMMLTRYPKSKMTDEQIINAFLPVRVIPTFTVLSFVVLVIQVHYIIPICNNIRPVIAFIFRMPVLLHVPRHNYT
jgi:hypothetical protein